MFRSTLGLLLLAAALAAQGAVHVVDLSGQGDFLYVQDAVDAAADGDTLLLRPGLQQRFIIEGKGLSLVAEDGAAVWCGPQFDGDNVMGAWSLHNEIRRLAAGQVAALRGLALGGLEIEDIAGQVWLQDCELSLVAPTRRATNVARLVLQGCELEGPDGFIDAGHYQFNSSGGALVASDSALAVEGCTLRGGNGMHFTATVLGYAYNGPGEDALRLSGGSLSLSGSTLAGGDGGNAGKDFLSCTDGGDGGAGLRLVGAAPVARSLGNATSGGAGGAAYAGTCGPFDPTPSQPGAPGAPTLAESGVIQAVGGMPRAFAVGSPVMEGDSVSIAFTGQPGELVVALVSLVPGLLPLPGKQGALQLGASLFVIPVAPLPASGVLALEVPLGELGPGLQTVQVFVQGLFCPGGCVLGPAAVLSLFDGQF
jgi:hypothetical protein